jgi:probable O-glycosylation ligase (exosortase A-associated)
MGIPLLGYLRSVMTHKLARLGATIAVGIFLLAVLSTQSRGAMIGLAVLALAGFTVSRRKWSYAAVMLVVGVAMVFLVPHKLVERADSISTAGDDGSFMGRVVAWKISTLIALDHPLGGGLHAVQIRSVWDQFVPEFDRLSFIPSPPPDTLHAAHSIYFEVLGDTGFPGLIVFGLILGSTMIALRRTYRRSRGVPDLYWAGKLAAQLQLTLLVYMVSGAALSAAYHDMPWLVIGLSGAVRRFVAEKVRATGQSSRSRAANSFRSPLAGTAALTRSALRQAPHA